jgi:hypothetical protein
MGQDLGTPGFLYKEQKTISSQGCEGTTFIAHKRECFKKGYLA